jgi:hypothetical protein
MINPEDDLTNILPARLAGALDGFIREANGLAGVEPRRAKILFRLRRWEANFATAIFHT